MNAQETSSESNGNTTKIPSYLVPNPNIIQKMTIDLITLEIIPEPTKVKFK